MTFMNSFVEEHIPEMKKFLNQISVTSSFFLLMQQLPLNVSVLEVFDHFESGTDPISTFMFWFWKIVGKLPEWDITPTW